MIVAAQRAQRDMAGYICDYVTKRAPIAKYEILSCLKGQQELYQKLSSANESTRSHARRQTWRVMSDILGRGTVRMAVECVNLLTMRNPHDVTAAESMKSSPLASFPCTQFIACQQRECKHDVFGKVHATMSVDARNPARKRIVSDKLLANKYGQRGNHPSVYYLSPYEFVMEYEVQHVK